MGEPFETRDALLGLGRRFICKGFIAEGGYWGGSPEKAGRFDGKGGGWRDINSEALCVAVASLVDVEIPRLIVLCNTSTRSSFTRSPSFTFVKGHHSLYAHPGNSAVALDCRE